MDKTILIVDDSAAVRTLARLALERAGCSVVEAVDGRDAVAKLGDARANLIVCDYNMPNMNGLAFAQHVKASALHRFTPIVMLTTSVDPKQKAAARDAGVAAWIGKPFEPATLVDAVERLCI